MMLLGAFPVMGQTVTDDGSTAPSGPNITYSQPQHGMSGGVGNSATAGVGEEFTLAATDPTLKLTDIYVKSSGGANPSAETLSWTMNLYNLTTSNQIVNNFSSLTVNPGDYLDFTINWGANQGNLVPGDTYAVTLTSSSTWYLAGIDKSDASDVTPAGVTSEMAVTGNGSSSSLQTLQDGANGEGDMTYYLQTTPEPPVFVLVLAAGAMLGLGRWLKIRAAAQG
jgi:hypothetical protein